MNITVVVPTYNEEKRLEKCLKSIAAQNVTNFTIETIIIDDKSSDQTISIAGKYGATVLISGHRDIEISKNIGLIHTKTELVCFLDADNWFPTTNWLMVAREALRNNLDAIGAQSAWFELSKNDPLANQYCSLLGCMDPAVYYLGSRDRLTYAERVWRPASSIVKENLDYWVVKIADGDTKTYGSQGFLTFTDKAKLYAAGSRFYHTDYVLDNGIKTNSNLIILKTTIGHDGCADTKQLFRKLHRNIVLFQESRDRKYKYNINKKKLFLVGMKLLTGVYPVIDAFAGFVRGPKTIAWFMHVPISVGVGVLYASIVVHSVIKKRFQQSKGL